MAKKAAKRKIEQETGVDIDEIGADVNLDALEYDEDMTVAEAEEMLKDAGVDVDALEKEADVDLADFEDMTLGEVADQVEVGLAQVETEQEK